MGIDFSHCDAHWAYSGFARFRQRVAESIGFPEYKEITTTAPRHYTKIKNDPIFFLLAHSDCDGHITPKRCAKLAPRLREILATWPDDHDKAQGLELCDGLEHAAESNEPLVFS